MGADVSDSYLKKAWFSTKRRLVHLSVSTRTGRYCRAFFSGVIYALESTAQYSALAALAITAGSLLGITVTPFAWTMIASIYVGYLVCSSLYAIGFINRKLNLIVDSRDEVDKLNLKKSALKQHVIYKRNIVLELARQASYSELSLGDLAGKSSTISNNVTSKDTKTASVCSTKDSLSSLDSCDLESDSIFNQMVKDLWSLYKAMIDKFFEIIYLKLLWRLVYNRVSFIKNMGDFMQDVVDAEEPWFMVAWDFLGLLSASLATVTGALALFSGSFAAMVEDLGIFTAFSAVTGVTGVGAIALFVTTNVIITSIFIVNKYLLTAPLEEEKNSIVTQKSKLTAKIQKLESGVKRLDIMEEKINTIIKHKHAEQEKLQAQQERDEALKAKEQAEQEKLQAKQERDEALKAKEQAEAETRGLLRMYGKPRDISVDEADGPVQMPNADHQGRKQCDKAVQSPVSFGISAAV